MDSLCNCLGRVKVFAKIGPVIGNLTSVRVKVDSCDVGLIPHFVPLVDLGWVVYPIQILLDVMTHLKMKTPLKICRLQPNKLWKVEEEFMLKWPHLNGCSRRQN